MGTCYHPSHLAGNVAHGDARLGGNTEYVYAFTHVVCLLHQCDRNGNSLLGTAVDVDATFLVINANDAIIDRVQTDQFATRVASTREQVLIYLLS